MGPPRSSSARPRPARPPPHFARPASAQANNAGLAVAEGGRRRFKSGSLLAAAKAGEAQAAAAAAAKPGAAAPAAAPAKAGAAAPAAARAAPDEQEEAPLKRRLSVAYLDVTQSYPAEAAARGAVPNGSQAEGVELAKRGGAPKEML